MSLTLTPQPLSNGSTYGLLLFPKHNILPNRYSNTRANNRQRGNWGDSNEIRHWRLNIKWAYSDSDDKCSGQI